MCAYLLDNDDELNQILNRVMDETLDTKSGSMTDGAVRFLTSERQVPAMLADVAEGSTGYCRQGWVHARSQHLFILM